MKRIALGAILLLVSASCREKPSFPKKDFLDVSWVVFMSRFPGGDPALPKDKQAAARATSLRMGQDALALHKQGKFEQAVAAWERAIEQHATADLYYGYGNSLSELDPKKSVRAYELSLTLDHQQPELVFYNIACAHSRLGETETALQFLRLAIDRGYNAFAFIKNDPDLANLRKLPDWEERLKAIEEDHLDAAGLPGAIWRALGPRSHYTYVLCRNGSFLETGTDFCGPGFKKGTWKLEDGDLVFEYTSSCFARIETIIRPDGTPLIGGTNGCLTGNAFFEPCSTDRQERTLKLRKDQVKGMLMPRTEVESRNAGKNVWSEDMIPGHRPLAQEPKQCDPDFVPKTLEDLQVEAK